MFKQGNVLKNTDNGMLVKVLEESVADRHGVIGFKGIVTQSSGYYPIGEICDSWRKCTDLWILAPECSTVLWKRLNNPSK